MIKTDNMENNSTENSYDVDKIRCEIRTVKDRLDRVASPGAEDVRRSVRTQVRKMKVWTYMLASAGIAGALFCFWLFYFFLGLSAALAVFTALFLIAAVTVSVLSVCTVDTSILAGDSLLETGRRIAGIRKRVRIWRFTACPLLAVWFVWTLVETLNSGLDGETVAGFITGCALGLAGALICTSISDRRQAAALGRLTRQIEELSIYSCRSAKYEFIHTLLSFNRYICRSEQ